MTSNKISIAVIGCGNWGKNHAHTLAHIASAELTYLCDANEQIMAKNIPSSIPGKRTCHLEEVLESSVSSVVIATPVETHYEIARKALAAGKHVLVEKPITTQSAEAQDLIHLAKEMKRTLMVGHLMYYHPTVQQLKKQVDDGEFGKIFFLRSERLNTGIIRTQENAWESLAPHDLSLLSWFLGTNVKEMHATGGEYLQKQICDFASASFKFSEGSAGQILVSWLDPVKVRRVTLVGEKKMAVFNDVPGGGLEIYNLKAVREGSKFKFVHEGIQRMELSKESALEKELEHFLKCVRDQSQPLTDGLNGLTVVNWLEEGSRQLRASTRGAL